MARGDPTCFSHAAPRKPTPHRVSWVEDPLRPEVHHAGPDSLHLGREAHHPGPALAGVVEEEEDSNNANCRDEEESREDLLTAHIRALARARSSYVARQYRCLRARLTSNSGNPYRPGDPATELLQDVRQLLTDLQNYLAKDPDVRAVFGNREPRVPRDEDLGNENRRETSQGLGECHESGQCVLTSSLSPPWASTALLHVATAS